MGDLLTYTDSFSKGVMALLKGDGFDEAGVYTNATFVVISSENKQSLHRSELNQVLLLITLRRLCLNMMTDPFLLVSSVW